MKLMIKILRALVVKSTESSPLHGGWMLGGNRKGDGDIDAVLCFSEDATLPCPGTVNGSPRCCWVSFLSTISQRSLDYRTVD